MVKMRGGGLGGGGDDERRVTLKKKVLSTLCTRSESAARFSADVKHMPIADRQVQKRSLGDSFFFLSYLKVFAFFSLWVPNRCGGTVHINNKLGATLLLPAVERTDPHRHLPVEDERVCRMSAVV